MDTRAQAMRSKRLSSLRRLGASSAGARICGGTEAWGAQHETAPAMDITELMTLPFSAGKGERVYAIGDVHGCWTLLESMLAEIRRDNDRRPAARTRIVLLGDMIDRGPDSRTVVEHLMRYTRASPRFVALKGNHEQLMVAALNGDLAAMKGWLSEGGGATLRSWGVSEEGLERDDPRRLLAAVRRNIASAVALWLERLPLTLVSGELVFVHAGVRPGVALGAQSPRDLLWIRDVFLSSEERRPFLVVHGHSISFDGPDIRDNRIGLDTGAYESGRLTAMGFEGCSAWPLVV